MRKLEYLEWVKESKEETQKARELVKKIEKAEFDIKRLSGNNYPYPLTYQYHFDERTFENVVNALSERGETFVKRAYLKMEREKVLVQYPNDEEVEEWKGQAEVEEIEKVRLMTVKEIRKKMKISQPEFGERMNIPKRTVQNWEKGVNECPEYTLIFIHEKAKQCFEERAKELFREGKLKELIQGDKLPHLSVNQYEKIVNENGGLKGQATSKVKRKTELESVLRVREKTGMTQKQLADVMNIPKRTLQNWENRTSKCPEYTLGFINERADEYFLCAYDYTEKQNKRA